MKQGKIVFTCRIECLESIIEILEEKNFTNT